MALCGYTTWPEKISVRGLSGWSDCLKMFSRRLPLIFIWRSVNPLFNFTHPASSFPALSLASTVAHLSAWPRSEASLLSTPMPLRCRRLWWELSYRSCVLPFCERRQRKKCLLPACFACQSVEDSLVTCLVQTKLATIFLIIVRLFPTALVFSTFLHLYFHILPSILLPSVHLPPDIPPSCASGSSQTFWLRATLL